MCGVCVCVCVCVCDSVRACVSACLRACARVCVRTHAHSVCHHQNDSSIKMGIDESHFNVSLIVRDKVARQCP